MRAATLLAAASLCAAGGCNVIGYGAYALSGPEKVAAQHEPEAVPTMLIVENAASPGSSFVEEEQLAGYLRGEVRELGLFPLVRGDELSTVGMIDPVTTARRDPAERGREAGAAQVLYVDYKGLQVNDFGGSGRFAGRAAAEVTLFDAETGRRLFPTDVADGRLVATQTEVDDDDAERASAVRVRTLQALSENVVKLFHEHAVGEE